MGDFTAEEIAAVYRLMAMRRDMRHFLSDPLDDALVGRLLGAAICAQRRIDAALAIHPIRDPSCVETYSCARRSRTHQTARALARARTSSCASKSRVFSTAASCWLPRSPTAARHHVFGRRTMPEMDLASVACAIQNLWLAARAENIGMGWVSLFDPEALRQPDSHARG